MRKLKIENNKIVETKEIYPPQIRSMLHGLIIRRDVLNAEIVELETLLSTIIEVETNGGESIIA